MEGFYLGEVHSPQPPFALIARLLSSWSSLPSSFFQLNLDIVFARRLIRSVVFSIQRAPAVDVTEFLKGSMDTQWEDIKNVLSENGKFPEVVFRLRSQEGPLENDEKVQLMDTIYSKLRELRRKRILTVEVSEPST